MNLTDIIMSLADAPGVAGDETQASELALSYLKKYTVVCYIKNGNVICNFGKSIFSKHDQLFYPFNF